MVLWVNRNIQCATYAPLCGSSLFIHRQHSKECFLRYLHAPDLLHALLPFLLLLEQLALEGLSTAVTFGQDILPHGADRLARNPFAADRRLDRHLEHLTWNQLFEFRAQFSSPLIRLLAGADCGKSG